MHKLPLLSLSLTLSACSVMSPSPALELIKATGAAVSHAVAIGPSEASFVVHHGPQKLNDLCIEYNPDAQVADLLPAIQNELLIYNIHSRIYEAGSSTPSCQFWLKYQASMEWDTPLLGSEYRSYMTSAMLTIQHIDGHILASSGYDLGTGFKSGKWSGTQNKIKPVVYALITGHHETRPRQP